MKSAVFFPLIVLGLGYVWFTAQFKAVNSQTPTSVSFVILPGETASTTISKLKSANLIRSALATRLYLQWTGLDQKLRPGSFRLSPSQDLKAQIATLASGPKDIWVTFPEGWRREQIAARLRAALTGFDTSEFIQLTASLEGQLFPDTYLIPADATAATIVSIMARNFTQKSGLTLPRDRATLILASLLEREARSNSDRPIIAGILIKRLKANWPLQVDATVQYAQNTSPNWWAPVISTKLPSRYNTYLHPGLPPTPISNPGAKAITAALHSAQTTYWYYIHDSKGEVHYAQTLGEHQANVDKYLRL